MKRAATTIVFVFLALMLCVPVFVINRARNAGPNLLLQPALEPALVTARSAKALPMTGKLQLCVFEPLRTFRADG